MTLQHADLYICQLPQPGQRHRDHANSTEWIGLLASFPRDCTAGAQQGQVQGIGLLTSVPTGHAAGGEEGQWGTVDADAGGPT